MNIFSFPISFKWKGRGQWRALGLLILLPLGLSSQSLEIVGAEAQGLAIDEWALEYFRCLDAEILSIETRGSDLAIGNVAGDLSSLNFTNGMVLTTGNVKTEGSSIGADGLMEQFANVNNNISDNATIDFSELNEGVNMDLSLVGITFIPNFDKLSLDYIFASEEFADYDCTRGDDLMGIVINGRGFDYDPKLKGELVSVLPGAEKLPIKVDNIHPETAFCAAANADYYQANMPGQIPAYSGHTTPFHTELNLERGTIYTLHFFVADNSDPSKDSGLFVQIEGKQDPFCGINTSNPKTIFEGCSDPEEVTINFEDFPQAVFPLFWELKGTATANVDYLVSAENGVILNAEEILNFTIDPVEDGEQEAMEEIILRLKTIDQEFMDYVWYIGDPIEELSVSRSKVCGIRETRVFVQGEQPPPNDYTFSIPAPDSTFRRIDAIPISISGVPFEYLSSPYHIKEVCIDLETQKAHSIYLVSPDNKRLRLMDVASNGIFTKDFQVCFGSEAIYSITYDYLVAAKDFEIPFDGPYYPFDQWEVLNNAQVNGVWRLEFFSSSSLPPVKVNDFSITFQETGTPALNYNWENIFGFTSRNVVPRNLNVGNNGHFDVSIQMDDCLWKDSILIDTSTVTEYIFEKDVCYQDTIYIAGESFYVGKHKKTLIYPNTLNGCCDSIVKINVGIAYPTGSFIEAFVEVDETYNFEGQLLPIGTYSIKSDSLTEAGCEKTFFINVLEQKGPHVWTAPKTNYSGQDYGCAHEENIAVLDSMSAAYVQNFAVYNETEFLGNVRDFEINQPTVGVRCQSLFQLTFSGIKRIKNQNIYGVPIDSFYFVTGLDYVNVLNEIHAPDINWVYYDERGFACPSDQSINIEVVPYQIYNGSLDSFSNSSGLGAVVGFVPSSIGLPVNPGQNQFRFETASGDFKDTVNFFFDLQQPIGTTDSFYIVTEFGQQGILPLIGNNLCGPISSITQVCEDNSTTAIGFTIFEDSLQFNTFEYGSRYICIELCDDEVVCDTLVFTVNAPDPLGIAEDAFSIQIQVYPNPTDDQLSIVAHSELELQIFQLYSSTGQIVKSGKIDSDNHQLSVADLPAGIYFLTLASEDQRGYKRIFVE